MTKGVDVHSGTIWTMIWWGLKLSLKFASNVILTRLLSPDMFGIAAIGNALIGGINMFSDFGIQQNIVRSHRNDGAYFQTAWTVELLRRIALTAVVVALAKPFAWLYGVDDLTTFMLVVAASNFAMGLNNIEAMRDYRHASLRKLALIDNGAAVVGLGAMVVWAWFSPTYIALAVGAVVSTSAFAAGTYLVYPRDNCRFCFEREAMADLVGFGKWVLISTVFAFATTQMDRLALGKLVSLQVLGIYSLAWMWASLPSQILEQWANRVFFPLASQQIRRGSGEETTWTARRLYVSMAAVTAVVMNAISDALVATVYTQEYQGVALLIRQLSIVFLLYIIEQSYSHVLVAQGRPRDKVAGQALSVCVFAAALVPVFQRADVAGVIGLLAVSAASRILWMTYKLFGARLAELRYDLLSVGGYFLLAPLMHAVVGAYDSRWYQVGASVGAGMLALMIALVAYRRLRQVCEVA